MTPLPARGGRNNTQALLHRCLLAAKTDHPGASADAVEAFLRAEDPEVQEPLVHYPLAQDPLAQDPLAQDPGLLAT